MAQHLHELRPLQTIDEEMPLIVANNRPSYVANRSQILSNAGTNRNPSRSTVRKSFNRSSNKYIPNNRSDRLNMLKEFRRISKEIESLQYFGFAVLIIGAIGALLKK